MTQISQARVPENLSNVRGFGESVTNIGEHKKGVDGDNGFPKIPLARRYMRKPEFSNDLYAHLILAFA